MPEMHFQIRWPDGTESRCYSPSLVIEDHIEVGGSYALEDFVRRIDTALTIASDRVRQKFGMPCSRALGQLAEIRHRARSFPNAQAAVTVMGFFR